MQFRMDIKDRGVLDHLDRLAERGTRLRPVLLDLGEEVRRITEQNFAAEGRPKAWKQSSRARREGGQTLTKTARLRRSITVEADDRSVRIGTNVVYAAIHQFGGRTPARIIRPVRAKALAWPGAAHPVKLVRHPGSRIPARPFLALTDVNERRLEAIAAHYLEKGK
jgi:phage virion morphogenesis protein